MTCINQPADNEEPTQTNKTRRSKKYNSQGGWVLPEWWCLLDVLIKTPNSAPLPKNQNFFMVRLLVISAQPQQQWK